MPEHLFPSRKPSIFPWVMALSGLLIVLLVALTIWQGLLPPVSSSQKNVLFLNQASGQVKEDQGFTLTSPGGEVRVYVPCCSLKLGGSVSLVMREPNLFPNLSGSGIWTRPLIANLDFSDGSGARIPNTESSAPLEICFRLTNIYWSHYLLQPTDFQIQRYNEAVSPNAWEEVPSYSEQSTHRICSQVTYLSLYALAIRGNPIPNTGPNGIYSP